MFTLIVLMLGSTFDFEVSTLVDCDGIMAMENQIATIEAAELAQDVKVFFFGFFFRCRHAIE